MYNDTHNFKFLITENSLRKTNACRVKFHQRQALSLLINKFITLEASITFSLVISRSVFPCYSVFIITPLLPIHLQFHSFLRTP